MKNFPRLTETEVSEALAQGNMKTIKTGTEIIEQIPSMRYIVQIIPLEGHPGQVGFEARVTCPDGRIVLTQQIDDLSIFQQNSSFRKDNIVMDQLAVAITAGLLDGLRKEIQDKVSQAIFKVMTK